MRSIYTQEAARIWAVAGFRRNGHAIKGKTDFCGEDPCHRRRHHAAAVFREEPLPKPAFEHGDLPVADHSNQTVGVRASATTAALIVPLVLTLRPHLRSSNTRRRFI